MARSFFVLLAAIAALLVPGCAATESDEVGESQGAWGHLQLDPRAPQFLVNKRPGQTWRACVPRYMTTMLPGIEGELEAAVNIWAHYVDRRIDVRIEVKDLPRAEPQQSVYELSRVYHAACGQGFDAVLGLAKLDGGTMGVTSGEGRVDAQGNWTSFTRFVFLRDFRLAPSTINGSGAEWRSFAGLTGRPSNADALLAMMKERSFVRYVEGGQRMSLPVLVHEIGHVWGLCDQYEGTTSCDPRNSTSHLVGESIMGASSMRERGYLTDDDVAGIRALVARPGFDAGWSPPSMAAPAPIAKPPLELLRLDRIDRSAGKIALDMGIVTNAPTQLEFAYRALGTSEWQTFQPMISEDGVDAPLLGMALGVDPVAAQRRLEARVTVSLRTAAGWAVAKSLSVSE